MVDYLAFEIIPTGILVSHALFVVLILALVFKNSWGVGIVGWIGARALPLAFLVALATIVGPLFYSEVARFEPCVLCWWQRVFLFPTFVIFGMALWKKLDNSFSYAVPLAGIASLIALYQASVYLGGASVLECTSLEGACSKIYVMEYGYITIPVMALTSGLYIILLAYIKKVYENSHT